MYVMNFIIRNLFYREIIFDKISTYLSDYFVIIAMWMHPIKKIITIFINADIKIKLKCLFNYR